MVPERSIVDFLKPLGKHTVLIALIVLVVAAGTFACPDCDAPVPLHVPVSPAGLLICPYCLRSGRAREFLSLAAPTRPARVQVRIVPR